MQPEGMVHALQQIHRLLTPDGLLIDIHPAPGALHVEIHHRGKILFLEQVPPSNPEAVQQADDALAHVIRRRLFTSQQHKTFDFRTYAASVGELRDHLIATSAFNEDNDLETRWQVELADTARRVQEALRAAGPHARVALCEQARITRLHPSPPK